MLHLRYKSRVFTVYADGRGVETLDSWLTSNGERGWQIENQVPLETHSPPGDKTGVLPKGTTVLVTMYKNVGAHTKEEYQEEFGEPRPW